MPDQPTGQIGSYELLDLLGEGAEGRVYKVRCTAADRPGVAQGEFVALKRLRYTGQEHELRLFQRQAEILRRLDHPGIVRYKDSFVWRDEELGEDVYCLVTELIEGEPLKSLMDRHPTGVPWAQTSAIIRQVLGALEYAAAQGVIHRDLKPSNVFLNKSGEAKLLDFGIARHQDSDATTTSSSANIKGTYDYMAPEWVHQHDEQAGFRGDEQSDIFSFGVFFYQVLTGKLPFPAAGGNLISFVSRWHAPTPPAIDYQHNVFGILSQARACFTRCLAVKRTERCRTFAEVLANFEKIQPRRLKHGADVYEFTDYLGKGGFGRVFRARRTTDGLDVAIKEMHNDGQSSRFIREAKVLQQAQHPNLVRYLDFVEVVQSGGGMRKFFLVLEHLEGMPGASLRNRIEDSENGLDPAEALQIFIRYLDCLSHLHEGVAGHAIYHRDIKPGNLYAPAGDPDRARIFDLGIAHDAEGTHTHGQVPGTLDYMPPEFATQESGRGSPQSDIFSIGVTLYQALTKSLPFPKLPRGEAEGWVAFYQRAANPTECRFAHTIFTELPELKALLRKALASDPKNRFESAGAMRDEIKDILKNWDYARRKKLFDVVVARAWEALDRNDLANAEILAREALEHLPENTEATELLAQAVKARQVDESFRAAMAAAQQALGAADYEGALKQANVALQLRPMDRNATDLRDQARSALAAPEEEDTAFFQRTSATTAAPATDDPTTAATKPVDPAELLRIEEDERRRKKQEEEQAKQSAADRERQRERDRHEAERRARAAEEERVEEERRAQGRAEHAAKARGAMLKLAAVLAVIGVLGGGGFFGYRGWSARQSEYRQAAAKASSAYENGDFVGAAALAEKAASLVVPVVLSDSAGMKPMRDRAQTQARKIVDFKDAVKRAQQAFVGADYSKAAALVKEATGLTPDHPAARSASSNEVAVLATVISDITRRFNDALKAGQDALARQDFAVAQVKAEEALACRAGEAAASKLRADAEKGMDSMKDRDQKFQVALKAGQDAIQKKDYPTALSRADEALTYKKGDPLATVVKTEAEKQLKVMRESEQKFQAALTAAQDALKKNDYGTALNRADEALALRPADPQAKSVKAEAEKQLALVRMNTAKYEAALSAAQDALKAKNYTLASSKADEALGLKANDVSAGAVKSEAEKQLALVRMNTAKYEAASKAASDALLRRDYTEAARRAGEVLALVPGDARGLEVQMQAVEMPLLERATNLFVQGQYEQALATVGERKGSERFKRLVSETESEKAALAQAQKDFDAGDYRFIDQIGKQKYASKKPFAALVADGTNERQWLKTLEAHKATNGWFEVGAYFQSQLAPLTAKGPFKEILDWSTTQARAMAEQRQQEIAGLDRELVELLENFNVTVPAGLKPGGGRKASVLGAIGEPGKEYYRSKVARLEAAYSAYRMLADKSRDALIKALRRNIDGWE